MHLGARACWLVVVSVVGCGHPATPARPAATPAVACAPPAEAEARTVKAIVDLYAALTADDLVRFRAVTTPDFYAYELGKRIDGDALARMIVDAHAKGRRFEWTVTQPHVRVDCNLAVVTYVNVGAIGDATRMHPRSWLESAALLHDAGVWRIAFFHSSPVPQP